MVRRGVGRVTAKDIAKAGDVEALIKQLVRQAADGDAEAKQDAAAALASMSTQSHNAHAKALFDAGAIAPLVGIVQSGTAKAQSFAAAALHALLQSRV